MDPVRNPYAPGAGQRPPELTGRDREISQFEVVLERIARGRPERSMVLTGLRGVGKTVLLNTFRSMALQRLWGTGKIEARPGQSIRPPVTAEDVSALCAACHELSQTGGPLIVVGAGLPHLPSVLSASKSYSERLFRYARIDRLDREAADLALIAPAQREDVTFTTGALDELYAAADGYPYFVQAYGKVTWDVAPSSPVTASDVTMSPPEAEGELAVGFFGSRYERATQAAREYMRAMAVTGDDPLPTSLLPYD